MGNQSDIHQYWHVNHWHIRLLHTSEIIREYTRCVHSSILLMRKYTCCALNEKKKINYIKILTAHEQQQVHFQILDRSLITFLFKCYIYMFPLCVWEAFTLRSNNFNIRRHLHHATQKKVLLGNFKSSTFFFFLSPCLCLFLCPPVSWVICHLFQTYPTCPLISLLNMFVRMQQLWPSSASTSYMLFYTFISL